jgi:hypothetical protein
MIRLAIAPAVALSATLVLGMQASDPPPLVDLGTLGHDVSVATAVNNRMQVVGWIADNFTMPEGNSRAGLWPGATKRAPGSVTRRSS